MAEAGTIWTNARVYGAGLPDGKPTAPGAIEIETAEGRIVAVGAGLDHAGRRVVDCEGRLLTPALVDCHTHIVHGGDRSAEFEARLEGASYEEIARAGGGSLRARASFGQSFSPWRCSKLIQRPPPVWK